MTEEELIGGLDRHDRRIYKERQMGRLLRKGSGIKRGECTGLLKVEEGELRVYLTGENGREITLFTLMQGEVCIMSSPCSFNSTTMDVYFQAVRDSVIKIVPPEVVRTIMERNIGFNTRLLSLMGDRMTRVLAVMDGLMVKSVDMRIGQFLLASQGVVQMTHEEVANHVGSSREVISRILKEFAAAGAVKLGRRRIEVVSRGKLEEIIKN